MRRSTPETEPTRPTEQVQGASGFGARSLLAWLAVVGGLVPFLVLWLVVRDSSSWLAGLDRSIAAGLNDAVQGSPGTVRALHVVTELAGTTTTVLLITLITAFHVIQHRWRLALFSATVGIGLGLLIPVSKALIGRARPVVEVPVAEMPSNAGYPSGHAMTAVVLWGLFALVALPAVRRRTRPWLLAGVIVLVAIIGFTRLALGVHYLTDVLAGWGLGVAWLAAMVMAFRTWPEAPHADRPVDPLHADPVDVVDVEQPERAANKIGRAPFLRLAGVAVAIVIVLSVLGLLVTGVWKDTWLGRWDRQVAASMVEVRTPALSDVASSVSTLSGTTTVIAVGVATGALALAATRSWRPMLFLAVALIGEVALYFVVAQTVDRARPTVADLTTGLPSGASWPSGHVAAAAVLYGGLAAIIIRYASARFGRPAAVAAVLITLAVAVSRLYVAAHHPTDVIAGALLGAAWILACSHHLLPPGGRAQPAAKASPDRPSG